MKLATVGDVSVQVRGVSYDKSVVRTQPSDGYLPLLRGGNIGDHGLIWNDLQYVPESIVAAAQILRKGDIVLAASSGSLSAVGKAARFDRGTPTTFGAFCKALRPAESVDAGYFGHYFKTTSYRKQVSRLAEGANINNLRKEHLDNLVFPHPSTSSGGSRRSWTRPTSSVPSAAKPSPTSTHSPSRSSTPCLATL